MTYFVGTEEALHIARTTPEMDTENFWIMSLIMANGDVYQSMTLMYTIDETLKFIMNGIGFPENMQEVVEMHLI
jgi:hypothetical protein